ncbi:MAG TPA: LptE family protein, partial [bacterium]|nr:LptE family protein [bacterium]
MNRKALLFLLLLCAGSGCGIYSVKGSMAPHLKTVAIPLFENRTAEFRVAEDLTDAVINSFTSDNSLKIADRGAADVLLEGTIIQIDDRAGAFDENESVQDMKIYLSVQIKCSDQ